MRESAIEPHSQSKISNGIKFSLVAESVAICRCATGNDFDATFVCDRARFSASVLILNARTFIWLVCDFDMHLNDAYRRYRDYTHTDAQHVREKRKESHCIMLTLIASSGQLSSKLCSAKIHRVTWCSANRKLKCKCRMREQGEACSTKTPDRNNSRHFYHVEHGHQPTWNLCICHACNQWARDGHGRRRTVDVLFVFYKWFCVKIACGTFDFGLSCSRTGCSRLACYKQWPTHWQDTSTSFSTSVPAK